MKSKNLEELVGKIICNKYYSDTLIYKVLDYFDVTKKYTILNLYNGNVSPIYYDTLIEFYKKYNGSEVSSISKCDKRS